MNDGQQPPQTPPEQPQVQIPPVAQPGPVPPAQGPPSQIPVPTLTPSSGGGKKPLVIVAILAVLIGLGVWAMMGMQDDDDQSPEKSAEETAKKAPKKRAKPRKALETSSRPMKKEMADLSAENRDKFEENVGKWVRLQGEVRTGDEEGVIVFKDPAKMRGQLVKGSAAHLTGQIIKAIGWLATDEMIQIDGIWEITTINPVDLLPKKDVYTTADAEQLIALRTTKASFQGKVESFRISGDKKNYYLIFEGESHEFIASADIKKMKDDKVTEKMLEKLVGKTVKVKGKLSFKKQENEEGEDEKKEDEEQKDKKDRIIVTFHKKSHYEVVE